MDQQMFPSLDQDMQYEAAPRNPSSQNVLYNHGMVVDQYQEFKKSFGAAFEVRIILILHQRLRYTRPKVQDIGYELRFYSIYTQAILRINYIQPNASRAFDAGA